MHAPFSVRRSLIVLALSLLCASAHAQSQAIPKSYEPQVGQPGKDVVWVPTPQTMVDKMLDMAGVTSGDYVIDLGSGDGRTVITAARRGATALGIEYNPEMVELSMRNAGAAGVTGKATFVKADLFASDFSKASVITMFLLPAINLQLRPKLLDLKPGTRIVSNSFTMEDWRADETATVTEDCANYCTAHFWIVPAKVQGAWQLLRRTSGLAEGELSLAQEFQMLSGTLGSTPITEGRLRGNEIKFSVGGATYTGRVNGNAMQGTISPASAGGPAGTWSATRR